MSAIQQILLAGSDWTPAQLSPLRWFTFSPDWAFTDAGATTPVASNGDLVYTLKDRSTNATNQQQATSGARAAYNGSPDRGTFDGARYYGSMATGTPSGLFSWHLFKTSTTGYHNLYDNSVAETMIWVDSNGRLEPDAQAGSWNSGPVITDGAWHTAFCWRSNTDATRLWVDGSEISGTGATRTIFASITLFARTATAPFNGDCADFGFATSLPSAGNRAALQTYLAGLVA